MLENLFQTINSSVKEESDDITESGKKTTNDQKQAEAEVNDQKQAEAEINDQKQAEAEVNDQKQAEAEVSKPTEGDFDASEYGKYCLIPLFNVLF
jgi:septal ring factor EnvC (AmiA/AmiB activator)